MSYTKTDMLSHNIIEILKEYSDEKHPLTQQQICGYLEKDYQIKPNRKTVAEHLKSITADERNNIDADESQKNGKPYYTNFYYVADMTTEEYELLADSIIYSPMLPDRYVKGMIKSINSLSTGGSKGKEASLNEIFHYNNQSIFLS